MNPATLAKLRSLPQNYNYRSQYPEGTRQPLTRELAEYLCSLIETNDSSLMQLLRDHPELPPWKQINSWQAGKPWFQVLWRKAHIAQAHFLAQKCLQLAKDATPKTAHVVRVQFDVYKWFCAKMCPDVYADKPATAPIQTVNVGVSISPERLTEIRSKLENTRAILQSKPKPNGSTSTSTATPQALCSPRKSLTQPPPPTPNP